ncbi:unnamed protein product [Ceutorhynchus assimilis]|uniref:Uncharacterized protein n=1 Tax=Ceutorhynchus assimilis TaxID=467358 RepID=A0A9N9MWI9_9CUCU|nr:unnamed protein product [Ceutorhynchus assimilis]
MAATPTTLVLFSEDRIILPIKSLYAVAKHPFQYGVKDISQKVVKVIVNLTYSPRAATLEKKNRNFASAIYANQNRQRGGIQAPGTGDEEIQIQPVLGAFPTQLSCAACELCISYNYYYQIGSGCQLCILLFSMEI